MQKKISVVLQSNAPTYSREVDGASKSTMKFGDAAGHAEGKTRSATKEVASFGSVVQQAASTMIGFVSAQAVINGVGQAISFVKDTVLGFDDEMTQSLAIMGDVSSGVRAQLEATARTVAQDYNQSVADTAQAYYYLVSAGYDVAQSQAALPQVTAFAKAGMIDLETATSYAADAQSAMGLKSDDAAQNLENLTRITDVLTKANIDANGSVEDFAKALTTKAAASARLAGISLEETVGVLEAWAAQGLKGKRAGEAFSIVLRDLQEKSRKNSDEFERLGIKVYDANGAFAGFSPIIGEIEKALEGMSVEQANATLSSLGFQAEAADYIKSLIGMSGEIDRYTTGVKDAGGATQDVAERQMGSMIERLKHMQSVAAELGLQGFDKLRLGVEWLGATFGPALENGERALQALWETGQPVVTLLAGLGGAAIVGSLTGLAKALEVTTGFLADHREVLMGLAILLGGLAFSSTVKFVGALEWEAEVLLHRLFVAVGGYITSLTTMVGEQGVAAAATAGLNAVLGSTAVQLMAAGALLAIVGQGFLESRDNANRYVDSLKSVAKGNDFRTQVDALNKMGAAWNDVNKKLENQGPWERFSTTVTDLAIPFHDVNDSALDLIMTQHKLEDEMPGLQDQVNKTRTGFEDLAKELAGPDAPHDRLVSLGNALVDLAAKNDIDVSKPVEQWKDRLKEAYTETNNASPALLKLRDAYKIVGDETATAEDRTKAYKDAIDSLIGIHISAFNAQTAYAASLADFDKTVREGGFTLNEYSEQGRKVRGALTGMIEDTTKHAQAVYEETNDVNAANLVLMAHREELIKQIQPYVGSRAAAENYINMLGLTPDSVSTLVNLNKQGAEAGLASVQGQINALPNQKVITVSADVRAFNEAMAKIWMPAGGGGPAIGQVFTGPDGQKYVMRGPGPQKLADGAFLRPYANGGVENHVAQIAPAGAWRMWAEPETGGEAYIPLGPAKRDRSTSILRQVASMFGLQLSEMANGGWGAWGAGHTVYEDGSYKGMPAWAKKAHDFAEMIQKQEAMRANPELIGRPGWGALAVDPFSGWAPGADFSQWGKASANPFAGWDPKADFSNWGKAMPASSASSSASVTAGVTIGRGAVQVVVSTEVGADPAKLARLVAQAVDPAMNEFAGKLAAELKGRRAGRR